jgi:predicted nucleic acid binding AN1-type Zn finger protein
MQDTPQAEPLDTSESIETFRLRIQTLETEIAAMRPILLRVAEARMCRDMATMIESCPYCTLKRGGEHGYSSKHDQACIVTQARALGF